MSTPKKHHYVPRVYLRSFAFDKAGNLYSFAPRSKHKNAKIRSINTAQVCYEEHMYRINSTDVLNELELSDPNYIEKNLFDYENSFLRKVLIKLARQENLTCIEASNLVDLIVSFRVRSKAMKKLLTSANIVEKTLDSALDEFEANSDLRVRLTQREFECVMQSLRTKFMQESSEETFRSDMYNQALKTAIENIGQKEHPFRTWTNLKFCLLTTDDAKPFITNDNPGFSHNRDNTFTTSFSFDTDSFYFPLSPTMALRLSPKFKEERKANIKVIVYENVGAEEYQHINRGSVMTSERWIFSNNHDILQALSCNYQNLRTKNYH